MIRRKIIPLVWAVLALWAATLPAYGESVATVTTTALKKGSLPVTLRVYGRVEAGADARQTIMTPVAATIENVFVQQGAEVVKGTPLVRLVPRPQVVSSYIQAQVALRVAGDLVRRTKKMVGEHLATAQQLAQAQQSQSDAEATLAALTKQGAKGPDILRAPFDAVVTAISVHPGAIVAEGSPLVDLSRPNGLILKAGAVPAQALTIAKGDAARITPLGANQSFSGTVILRGQIADPTTGLVPVEISLPAGKFFPGQSVEAVITTGNAQGYIVPHEAILVNEKGGNYVVQAVSGAAKLVPVQILVAGDTRNVVNGRLDASAPVVLTGNYQLEEGMKLRVDPPLDNKAAQ